MSCVEAFAAALSIVGLQDFGAVLLDKFKWGHGFYSLNSTLLDAYAKCESAQAVIECDTRFRRGEGMADDDDDRPNRDMPPSESSSDDDDEEEENENTDLHVEKLSLKTTDE